MFDPCVDATITLINSQRLAVEQSADRRRVRAILLSGGFAGNAYLHARVNSLCTKHGIDLLTPDEGERWTAVAKGAVLMSLEIGCAPPLDVTKCPIHIGVIIAPPFMRFDHTEEQLYKDSFDQQYRAKNHIHWIVPRGDPIPHDGTYQKTIKIVQKLLNNSPRDGKLTIITSDYEIGSRPPARVQGMSMCKLLYGLQPEMSSQLIKCSAVRQTELTLRYDLSRAPPDSGIWNNHRNRSVNGNMEYHKVEMDLEIEVRPEKADIHLIYGARKNAQDQNTRTGYLLGTTSIQFRV